MSDSGSNGSQFVSEMKGTVTEVVKDVKDAVGEMVEQGVQSAVNTQLTPQQLQQKQADDQKKEIDKQKQLAYTRKWIQNLAQAAQKVRMENQQKEQQRLQVQQQEKQVTEMKEIQKKKQPVNQALAYAGKVELKRGVGG